jgi:hypothetical protein
MCNENIIYTFVAIDPSSKISCKDKVHSPTEVNTTWVAINIIRLHIHNEKYGMLNVFLFV